MATRKAITLVSGLFQEVNTPTDKLDFAGNTTADLSENTNLYFTNSRARGAVSVTDSGGFGSLAYNSSTGVITYTGPSNSDVRGTLSVASGEGLTYDASTGEFGTSAIPNSQLANSSITLGATGAALGQTVSTISGLTSLTSTNLVAGSGANSILLGSGNITFEGSTDDANETILTAADATGGDKTLTLPNETGTILTTASSIANSNLVNSSFTIGSTSVSLGATTLDFAGVNDFIAEDLYASGSTAGAANSINVSGVTGTIIFEGATANNFETSLGVTDPTADRTITFPDATGTVALLSTLSIASGSGLTYNSSTGEFSTNAIPNFKLANSSITIGGTGVALGGSITTFSGLSSVTADAVVTKTGGFRVIDSTDNTKQLAFDASAISGSTTRTLAVPDENGTLVTSGAIVNADINASAAIAGTKISPDFGSQNIETTGYIEITSTVPSLFLMDSNNNPDYVVRNLNGSFSIRDYTSSADRFTISSGGQANVYNNLNVENTNPKIFLTDTDHNSDFHIANTDGVFTVRDATNSADRFTIASDGTVNVAGSITLGGTVDGVDIATRDTLFGGLTSSSGALTNGVTATTQSASDNSTKVATTAYVDNQVTAGAVNEFADNVFRVKDNSDASKKLAFECSGISGSTTRTMTVPNTDGTISTESFATAIAVALG